MKPAPFEYFAPGGLEEALQLLQRYGADARILAGGQSLIPAMNFRLAQPAVLIDMNRIPALAFVRAEEGRLRLGAMTPQAELERHPEVREKAPLLAAAVSHIAHPQIRNRGTLGGSLAHADPAAELPAVMTALEARFRLQGPTSERWLPAQEFFVGPFMTQLSSSEVLCEVALDRQAPGCGWSFQEVSRRQGDYALVGVAVLLERSVAEVCTRARIVFVNGGDRPQPAFHAQQRLLGKPCQEQTMKEAAEIAAWQDLEPPGDLHASPDFRRHLAQVLLRRALAEAASRTFT